MHIFARGSLLLLFLCLVQSCAKTPIISKREAQPSSQDSIGESETPKAPTPVQVYKDAGLVVAVSLQSKATEILRKNCEVCHQAGNALGNFGTVLNIEAMIASNRYLVPGSPEKSLIFTRLAPTGNMPPAGALKQEEIATLSQWITDLQPGVAKQLSESDVVNRVRQDLEAHVAPGQRFATRYFTLHVPQNLGATPATLGILRQAFFKTLNSVSRAPVIVEPKSIDNDGLIYRVQVLDIAMTVAHFDRVMGDFYPFSQIFIPVGDDPVARRTAEDHQFLKTELGTENYLIRADWFAATAPLPRLYSELLQLGTDQIKLQAQLGVNQVRNITDNRVVRAGFQNSNVSSQNRIIERHVQANGLAYWMSYDFASNSGMANVFNAPLGPTGVGHDAKAFVHDGGEMIFHLPNGLFGYYLATAAGEKIDKGPTSIVLQKDGPSQFASAIVNGISCMNCHGGGLLHKKDEVRNFVTAQVGKFSPDETDKVVKLYVEEKTLKELIEKDNSLYFRSLNTLGINPSLPDPVTQAFGFYNRGLSRNDVRVELGLTEAEFARLMTSEPFHTQWNSLNRAQGFIKRDDFQTFFHQAIDGQKDASQPVYPRMGDIVITPQCMSADLLKMENCLLRRTMP